MMSFSTNFVGHRLNQRFGGMFPPGFVFGFNLVSLYDKTGNYDDRLKIQIANIGAEGNVKSFPIWNWNNSNGYVDSGNSEIKEVDSPFMGSDVIIGQRNIALSNCIKTINSIKFSKLFRKIPFQICSYSINIESGSRIIIGIYFKEKLILVFRSNSFAISNLINKYELSFETEKDNKSISAPSSVLSLKLSEDSDQSSKRPSIAIGSAWAKIFPTKKI